MPYRLLFYDYDYDLHVGLSQRLQTFVKAFILKMEFTGMQVL